MSDHPAIQDCVDRYYQSLCTSDPDGVGSVFIPAYPGYCTDGLHEMTVDDFVVCAVPATFTAESGAESMLEILSLRSLATPRPSGRESYLGMLLDNFGMLQADGQWLI